MKATSIDIYQGIHPKDYGLIFKAIMQHSKDGLFVTDHRGKVVMINRATEEMCDIKAYQVLGRNVRDLVKEGFWNPAVSLQVIEKKRPISLIQTTRRDKKLLSTGIPIFDDQNELKFVLVNDRDISFLSSLIETLDTDVQDENPLRFELSDYGLAAAEMEGVVIRSPAMVEVFQIAGRAAKFNISLVLTGESGVGKSMVARLIHQLSDRRNGPFIDLNCGAIAESLIESELFGHERGAFTGASSTGKRGLFEVAHDGTLFLDEIGEIPLPVQVKLLKFLETKQILKVGAVSPQKINTRIIAATNQDLETMVDGGKFRSDLFYRLNEVPIHIPALRERSEDIDPFIQHFLARYNKEFNTRKIISKTVREALCQYRFPGNVRELENLIKRLVTMTEGDFIRLKNIPALLLKSIPGATRCSNDELQTYQQEVASFEIKIIKDAIRRHGSQRKAARALGLRVMQFFITVANNDSSLHHF
ncbi:MAG: sigma 54-interacting transcriptional regulator [Desulfosarcina sp.]|nr:sigma 54-interacting transcriptional regulator [Desulfosarcina sp.]